MNHDKNVLEYDQAPREPFISLRQLLRVVCTIAVFGVGIWLLWTAVTWNHLMRVQNRCMLYHRPANQIALQMSNGKPTSLDPAAEQLYCEFGEAAGWRYFLYPRQDSPEVILFMHERRLPTGESRLVIVPWSGRFSLAIEDVCAFPRTVVPATLSTYPIQQPHKEGFASATSRGDPRSLRVFAGQPDPVLSDRFDIPFEIDGKYGKLRGKLIPFEADTQDELNRLQHPASWFRDGELLFWVESNPAILPPK
jgi:hypothetical protein